MTSPHTPRGIYAVLTAAGSGTRLGCDQPKALVPVGGQPMLLHAARGLLNAGVDGIVITAPATHIQQFEAALAPLRASASHTESHGDHHTEPPGAHSPQGTATVTPPLLSSLTPQPGPSASEKPAPRAPERYAPIRIVEGGATRQASVAAGLAAVASICEELGRPQGDEDVILIHDAARALTPPAMIHRVIDAVLAGSSAVIPALPVADTLKVINRDTATATTIGSVHATADRSALVAVQTPQGFPWHVIRDAHERSAHLNHDETHAATDDAGLVESLGGHVDIVPGDSEALKITTPWDLRIAHHLLTSEHP